VRRALAIAACLLACLGVGAALLTPGGSRRPATGTDGVLAVSAGDPVEVALTTTTTLAPPASTSTTMTPVTTRVPPTTAAPRPPATVAPSGSFAPLPFPIAPLPAGAEPWQREGASKTATNGTDTLAVHVFPYDLSVDTFLQLTVDMTYVGGVNTVRYDFGDGTSVVHDYRGTPPLWCEPPFSAVKTHSDSAPYHYYPHAGTYSVKVTLTTVDCETAVVVPAPVPTTPGLPGPPPFSSTASVGQERVTSASIDIVQRADRYPLPRGPEPSP
jgi:hypothetical protein